MTPPRPPEQPDPVNGPPVAAIVLAAGGSRRMGGDNKLLAEVAGKPMVAHVVDACRNAGLRQVVLVTGHEGATVAGLFEPSAVEVAHNPGHASGMAGSIRAGLDAVQPGVRGVLICLGDMPGVRPATLRRLVAALRERDDICVPYHAGRPGNPVLWGAAHLQALRAAVTGDQGGRRLLRERCTCVRQVAVDDPLIRADADTPEALAQLRSALGHPDPGAPGNREETEPFRR